MIEAAIGAGLAAFGLVAGYLIAEHYHPGKRLVGQAMGLGAGVLMAVVAYALVLETTETAERPAIVGAGLAIGALVFYYGSLWLDRRSASGNESGGEASKGLPLALGAVRGLPDIYRAAGAELTFDPARIGELVQLVESEIERVRSELPGS